MEAGQTSSRLPIGRLEIAPFGPTGIINNNSFDAVGQGLKKIFSSPVEMPRHFKSGPEVAPQQKTASSNNNDSGGGGTLKEFLVCEDGEPVSYNFYILQ